jgi:dTMP kinase
LFSLEWCKQPEKGLIKPDIVIFLDLPVDVASKRAQYGDERYEKAEFQKQVAKCYQQLREPDWKILDASQAIEDLHSEIKALTTKAMEDCKEKPVEKLWQVQ